MQTSQLAVPVDAGPRPRTRPSYGPLFFGSFFLWGGVAGILHGTTTMGLGPSLTIALSATGIAVFVVTLLPRLSASRTVAVAEGAPVSDTGLFDTALSDTALSDTGLSVTGLSPDAQPFDPEQLTSETAHETAHEAAGQAGHEAHSEADKTAELDKVGDAKTPQDQEDPWDADQGWASDIRW